MSKNITIGCLALQGCVDRHAKHVEAAGASFMPVKTKADFEKVDGFILPGGESTTMLRLIKVFDLWETLAGHFSKKPVWGICAGTILMAENAFVNDNLSSHNFAHCHSEGAQRPEESDKRQSYPSTSLSNESSAQDDSLMKTQKSFGLLPIDVLRNGYGTQLESHIVTINGYDVSFIRAPIISKITDDIEVKAQHQNTPVWIQGQGARAKYVCSTFHPELTFDFPSPMHQHFVDIVKESA